MGWFIKNIPQFIALVYVTANEEIKANEVVEA
jgi:hypothetical protein